MGLGCVSVDLDSLVHYCRIHGLPESVLDGSHARTLVYDVAHNIAKYEEHAVNGQKKKLWVHRKGATRAFPANHPEVRFDEVRVWNRLTFMPDGR